ncbi:MAG: tRNA (N(6)-L-threonylcarbamoyladenosine(37)-C(2))-methylthiotransferase MtaB [Clostridia bacterium]|nr:tRNA (N(6)-L-threonylcarbamoyladenosine(37)-C(2))-methylthiotransferase MtaB [Clostridia bacterium]
MKAVVFTLGCKVNQCESASLAEGLKEAGFEVSDELSPADLYIINTCAVTSEAEKKSRQAVARVEKFNKNAKIIITGCASERSPSAFSGKPNVYLVTGAKSKDRILDLIDKSGIFIDEKDIYYEKFLPARSSRTRSYIKVQDGCNNFCTYCIVPYLRGRSRSRDPENIKREIETLNPVEAVITGIDLSDYDFEGMGLADLLFYLKDYDMRIRLGSLEVRAINEKFLDATKALKDFAPHFHLSLQSGSNAVLKSMNRKYTREEYLEKVRLIRKYYPDCAVTTDIIAGFSTEKESDFEDTISLIKEVGFADIHCFAYSKRSGTVAAEWKELPPELKRERLNRLLCFKKKCISDFTEKNLGRVHEFIPEEEVYGMLTGYTANYLRVYVKDKVTAGRKYKVVPTEKYNDGAIAEIKE